MPVASHRSGFSGAAFAMLGVVELATAATAKGMTRAKTANICFWRNMFSIYTPQDEKVGVSKQKYAVRRFEF
jgi:hypothetical protein